MIEHFKKDKDSKGVYMHLCKDWNCFKFLNYHVNYLVKYVLYMYNCIHEKTIKSSCILYLSCIIVGSILPLNIL